MAVPLLLQPVRDGVCKAIQKALEERPLQVIILDLSPVIGGWIAPPQPPHQAAHHPVAVLLHSICVQLKRWMQLSTRATHGFPALVKAEAAASCLAGYLAADIDASAVHALHGLVDQLQAQGLVVALVNPSQQVGRPATLEVAMP